MRRLPGRNEEVIVVADAQGGIALKRLRQRYTFQRHGRYRCIAQQPENSHQLHREKFRANHVRSEDPPGNPRVLSPV